MELITPDLGIMFWVIFSFLSLALFLAAVIGLMVAENMDVNVKLGLTLFILFVPTIGPILFFILRKRLNSKKVVSQNNL